MNSQVNEPRTLTITKTWTWSGPTTRGWKALGTLTGDADGAGGGRIMISHSSATVPRINETLAVRCFRGTDDPDWGDELTCVGGSVSPQELFPAMTVAISPGVEELWRES